MDQQAVEFENIINAILSRDNELRRQAEQTFLQVQQDGNTYYTILTTLLAHSQNIRTRMFAAVLMRQQLLPGKRLFFGVSPEVAKALKDTCTQLFKSEQNDVIRNKVIELISVLAAFLFTRAQERGEGDITIDWPEIIPLSLSGCDASMPPMVQQACFQMINKLSEFCVSSMIKDAQQVGTLLVAGMESPHLPVAISAATCSTSLIASLVLLTTEEAEPSKQQYIEAAKACLPSFHQLIPLVFRVLQRACDDGDTISMGEIINSIDQIVRLSPHAFEAHLSEIIQFIDSIARQDDLDSLLRHSAVTLLVSFGNTPKGRKIARAVPLYKSTMLRMCFDFLKRIELSEKWSSDPENVSQDEEDFPDFYMGIYILENLPIAMGLKSFMGGFLKQLVIEASKHPISDWKSHCAYLTALHTVAKEFLRGFPKTAIPSLSDMVTTILKAAPNDRVKVAACSCVSHMVEKFTQDTSMKLLAIVVHLAGPTSSPTVLYYAMHAMSHLIGHLKSSRIGPHVQAVIESAIRNLQHPNMLVKLLALSLISTIALNQQELFHPFCENILNGLFDLVRTTNQHIGQHSDKIEAVVESRRMRSKALETISYIAGAVGAEAFHPYLQVTIALMAETQNQELSAVNPEVDLILRSYERLSENLGDMFTPFIPLVLPGIFKSASAENFIYRFDVDENNQLSITDQAQAENLTKERGFHSISVGLRGIGNQIMYLNVAVVQDKIQALELIGQFAVSQGAAFAPYVHEAASVLFPCCTSTANPRIRMSAVTSVPALVECYAKTPNVDPQSVMNFFSQCLQAFDLPTWVKKELPEGLSFLLGAITASLDVLPSTLPAQELQLLKDAILQALELSKERRASIEEEVDGTDEEHVEDKVEAMGQENRVLDSIIALNTELIRSNTLEYMPFFNERIAPELEKMITQTTDPYMTVCGFVGFADAIGTAKEHAAQYIQHLLPRFIQHAAHPTDHELRRGCAYGIAACHRQMSRQEFFPFLGQVVTTLVQALSIEEDDPELSEELEFATDNVLVGLCDIITRFGFGDEALENFAATYIPYVLPKLGRFHDEAECKSIHKNYALWLSTAPSLVYGEANEGLSYVIVSIATILDYDQDYDIIDEEDKVILMNTWRTIRSSLGAENVEKIIKLVPHEIRSLLDFE